MRLKSESTEQKIRGAYYTPQKLADFMVRLFEKDDSIETILEPSCGDGVFVESILNNKNLPSLKSVTAVEIVEEEAKKVIKKTGNNNKLNVIINDFILMYDELLQNKKFDLVVGNPPYIRYQYLTEEQRELQSQILISNKMKSNKLINVWVCFLVACVQLLNKNGKIAFVIPAELLQVAYAEDLRLYLSNSFSKITLITFRELVFPSIEQEIILFIGEKDEKAECENALIGVKELQSLDELDNFSFHDIKYQKVKHTKEKWTKYFTNDNEVKLIESIKQDDRFVQFQDISIVNVGITTGDNNYFSVNDDVVKEFKFKNIALPLIGRSAHARGVYFTKEDWKYNIGKGKNAYLLVLLQKNDSMLK
jgi:adenine-specific DNA-methyltransferase